jgi:class 3 adenylate cyclase
MRRAPQAPEEHRRELVDPKIKEQHGRIVKTTGDGLLVEFSSVVDAVRCAVEVQRAMFDSECRDCRRQPDRLPNRRHLGEPLRSR